MNPLNLTDNNLWIQAQADCSHSPCLRVAEPEWNMEAEQRERELWADAREQRHFASEIQDMEESEWNIQMEQSAWECFMEAQEQKHFATIIGSSRMGA